MNLYTSYISTIFECISIKKDPEPKLQISLNTYHLQYRCTNVHYFKLQSIYSIYDIFPTSDSFSTYHSALLHIEIIFIVIKTEIISLFYILTDIYKRRDLIKAGVTHRHPVFYSDRLHISHIHDMSLRLFLYYSLHQDT